MSLGYKVEEIYGFVDALINEDDPEYHWKDSFRSSRFSNYERQKLLYKLSGELRRQIGKEVLELGGNAVVGLKQCFDYESEANIITARVIGTCVKLSLIDGNEVFAPNRSSDNVFEVNNKVDENVAGSSENIAKSNEIPKSLPLENSVSSSPFTPRKFDQSNTQSNSAKFGAMGLAFDGSFYQYPSSGVMNTPFSLEDPNLAAFSLLSKKNSTAGDRSTQSDIEITTLHDLPDSWITSLGGIVSARSVKLIQSDEEDIRDGWWVELRDEVKSHAKALGCNSVIGYTESVSLHDELIVLSVIGTAANINWKNLNVESQKVTASDEADPKSNGNDDIENESELIRKLSFKDPASNSCSICHIPYKRQNAPFPMTFTKCQNCKKRYVPEILMTNVELPDKVDVIGEGKFVDAQVVR